MTTCTSAPKPFPAWSPGLTPLSLSPPTPHSTKAPSGGAQLGIWKLTLAVPSKPVTNAPILKAEALAGFGTGTKSAALQCTGPAGLVVHPSGRLKTAAQSVKAEFGLRSVT